MESAFRVVYCPYLPKTSRAVRCGEEKLASSLAGTSSIAEDRALGEKADESDQFQYLSVVWALATVMIS